MEHRMCTSLLKRCNSASTFSLSLYQAPETDMTAATRRRAIVSAGRDGLLEAIEALSEAQ